MPDRYGRCDVFVHCAAAFDQVTINDVDAATWRHVQAVNVESALWLLQAFVPGMAERHFGHIVFIISDTFWVPPSPVLLAYTARRSSGGSHPTKPACRGEGVRVDAGQWHAANHLSQAMAAHLHDHYRRAHQRHLYQEFGA